MRRRTFTLATLAAATALPGAAAWSADAYPNKPLKLIVGFAPGGGADALTRIIAEGLAKQLAGDVKGANEAWDAALANDPPAALKKQIEQFRSSIAASTTTTAP